MYQAATLMAPIGGFLIQDSNSQAASASDTRAGDPGRPGPIAAGGRAQLLPPLLDLILNGGPSLTFNLIELCPRPGDAPLPADQEAPWGAKRPRFFRHPRLNRTILFKYPNIDIQALGGPVGPHAGSSKAPARPGHLPGKAIARPMETGIFIPYDPGNIRLGGDAVYLRHPRHHAMLEEQFGLRADAANPDACYDFALLNQIDSLPSLDPFLMKTELIAHDPFIDQSLFGIDGHELARIKERIHVRFRTILRRALPAGNEAARSEERFLESLWDPAMPESELFIAAFGIEQRESSSTFEALKGVTYYELALAQVQPSVLKLTQWLSSRSALPADWNSHRRFQEQYDMFRASIRRRLAQCIAQVREIFNIYHHAYRMLVNNSLPGPFCEFLRQVPKLYWHLGYFTAAFSHAASLHAVSIGEGRGNPMTFERTMDFLRRLDAIFSRAVAIGGEKLA